MRTRLLLSLVVIASARPCAAQAVPQYPFPQHVAYAAGTTRPSHRSQAQLDEDVRAYYAQWKQEWLVPAGIDAGGLPLYRISFGRDEPERTVSEGQGYGMIIVAIMAGDDPDAQALFDRLWRLALQHPTPSRPRLMAFPGSE